MIDFIPQGWGGAPGNFGERIRRQIQHAFDRCGDVFQGTPYFTFLSREVEYKAISAIGSTQATLGNHEFDNGVDALAAALKLRTSILGFGRTTMCGAQRWKAR